MFDIQDASPTASVQVGPSFGARRGNGARIFRPFGRRTIFQTAPTDDARADGTAQARDATEEIARVEYSPETIENLGRDAGKPLQAKGIGGSGSRRRPGRRGPLRSA
ncbi:MAG: hypothetical protein V3R77_02655 [Candidatus Binatia bacterium]